MAGLVQDFGAGRGAVAFAVGQIVELVRYNLDNEGFIRGFLPCLR